MYAFLYSAYHFCTEVCGLPDFGLRTWLVRSQDTLSPPCGNPMALCHLLASDAPPCSAVPSVVTPGTRSGRASFCPWVQVIPFALVCPAPQGCQVTTGLVPDLSPSAEFQLMEFLSPSPWKLLETLPTLSALPTS